MSRELMMQRPEVETMRPEAADASGVNEVFSAMQMALARVPEPARAFELLADLSKYGVLDVMCEVAKQPDPVQARAYLVDEIGIEEGGQLTEDARAKITRIKQEAELQGCEDRRHPEYLAFHRQASQLLGLMDFGQYLKNAAEGNRYAQENHLRRHQNTRQALADYFAFRLTSSPSQAVAVREPQRPVDDAFEPVNNAIGTGLEAVGRATEGMAKKGLEAIDTATEYMRNKRHRQQIVAKIVVASAVLFPFRDIPVPDTLHFPEEVVEATSVLEPQLLAAPLPGIEQVVQEKPSQPDEPVPDESPAGTTGEQSAPEAVSEAAQEGIPAEYLALYQAAAAKEGIDWTILAGIGKVESNHGQSAAAGVSEGQNFHGCCAGPMQFFNNEAMARSPQYKMLHSVWTEYGVDGNNDGVNNVYDPADAIPAAARKLVANNIKTDLQGAIWGYNRSHQYYHDVMDWAATYAGNGELPD